MSASVVDITANLPHRSGLAKCLACEHTWMAVAPAGVWQLECPACHTRKGVFNGLTQKGDYLFICSCGCDLFRVSPEGPYCINCGVMQEDPS